MRTLGFLVALILVSAHGFVEAADPVEPTLETTVTLKIPTSLLDLEVSMFASLSFSARVSGGSNGVVVGDDAEWQTAGFPSMLEASITRVKRKKALNMVQVVLRSESPSQKIKIEFFGATLKELPMLLGEVVVTGGRDGEQAKAYMEEAYSLLASKMFTGPLEQLTHEQQMTLMRFAHLTASGTRVGSESFKEETYLVVDLGTDSSVYNTLQLDQAERVAKIVNERLLTILKAFASPVRETPFIYGLKIELRVPHRSFADEYAAPDYDELELFVPGNVIREFADLEITSQELIDASVVIVNSNRIAVPLAG